MQSDIVRMRKHGIWSEIVHNNIIIFFTQIEYLQNFKSTYCNLLITILTVCMSVPEVSVELLHWVIEHLVAAREQNFCSTFPDLYVTTL